MPLMFFDNSFYIPQNLCRQFIRRRTDGIHHVLRIEIEDKAEIFIVKMFGGVKAAARHQGVRDTAGQHGLKGNSEIIVV
jgi:hypothetical protein